MRRSVVLLLPLFAVIVAPSTVVGQRIPGIIDPVDPVDPTCFARCDEAFRQAVEACVEPNEAGEVRIDNECVAAAEREYEACLADCGIEPPPPPPIDDCATVCEMAHFEAMQACFENGRDPAIGAIDEQCLRAADEALDACLEDCGVEPPPPVDDCETNCLIAHERALEACFRDGNAIGAIDNECMRAAEERLNACLEDCGIEPPPPVDDCPTDCDRAFQEAIESCFRDENGDGILDPAIGAIDDECMRAAEEQLNACLEDCGIEPPPPVDDCATDCDRAFQEAMRDCFRDVDGDGNVDPNVGIVDDECVRAAEEALSACLEDCGIEPPPPPPEEFRCASECDRDLEAARRECANDEECASRAFAAYDERLRACGMEVPEIPRPDPCLVDCDRAYREAIEACMTAAGEMDAECMRAADEQYVSCLESCGVEIPDVPFPEPDPCMARCDMAYREAVQACIGEGREDAALGVNVAMDDECLRAADDAYVRCLEGCGVDIPEPPDGPEIPGGECLEGCGELLLNQFLDCFDADGTPDLECVTRLGEEFSACLEACEDDDAARLLGALLRGGADEPFLRGDADRNADVNLTDAVAILNELFGGNEPSDCPDAQDANDDGAVDLSDPVAILNRLFLGAAPLPPPSAEPGVDPTEDELGCR